MFDTRYSFLAAIPRLSHLPVDAPAKALTLDPSDPVYCDHLGSYNAAGEPLVKFHPAKPLLIEAGEELRTEVDRFIAEEEASASVIRLAAHTPAPELHAFLRNLVITVCDAAIIVKEVPMPLNDFVSTIRRFQRSYLEALAYMDYLRSYSWRMHSNRHDNEDEDDLGPHVNMKIMGAYSTEPLVVARLYRAGIPVWYIRTYTQLHEGLIIRSVVAPRQPDDTLVAEAHPRGATLYAGPPGVQQLDAIHVFNADTHQRSSIPHPRIEPEAGARRRSRSPDATAASSSTASKRPRVEDGPRATGK